MSKRRLGLLAGVSLVALGAGVAYAAIPDAGGQFNACMLNNVGTIRLIDPSLPSSNFMSHCTQLETAIKWSQTGPQGPPGPQGLQGPQGPQGLQGPAGPSDGYFAENVKRITVEVENTEELVGLSGLPAGSYMVWFTVAINQEDEEGDTRAVVCKLTANGALLTQGLAIFDEESAGSFDRGALSGIAVAPDVPNQSRLIVSCGKRLGDEPRARGRIMALEVGTIQ